MYQPIAVTYTSTNDVYDANQMLATLQAYPIIACDFEAAIKYSATDLASFQAIVDNPASTKRERVTAQSRLSATALDHVSHTTLTHCSIAWSESEAFVFILDNPRITKRILNFLTTTTLPQVWHNASYDFRHIYYHTHKFPLNYEDSQLLAKSVLNHVNNDLSLVGLKELCGKWYGQWAISPDNFDISHMYDSDVLLYSATDSCATFKLYHSIREYIATTKASDDSLSASTNAS